MIEFYFRDYVPRNFTGVCKLFYDKSICYYKNGELHREDGPSVKYPGRIKDWCYKGKCYGINNDFTIESWKEKVEELKREEELKIFI
jgi:hypothetical protein